LRTLPGHLAEAVARWLVAAAAEPDPDRAFEFAIQARKLAARVGVVRETAGVAAYRAGRWADALAELRTARRLTGRVSYLPLMADAERALGRADRALALIHDPDIGQLDRATQIELLIVESGIRRDQGRAAAGAVVLQVPELTEGVRRPWSARLLYAYADALYDADRMDEARDWFGRAAAADPDEETDAAERYEIMDGVVIEDLTEPEDERAENERADDERAENERAENERADDERAENERADDERAENERADDEQADDEQADDEQAGDELAAGGR
jgi:tetratricopeptide (TPR) repeat protein